MPAAISDIHELSVIIGISEELDCSQTAEKKFKTLQAYTQRYGLNKINISESNFLKKISIFNRGVNLGIQIKRKLRLQGKDLEWSGLTNHKKDSSDIYCNGHGISLKDTSKII